MFDTKAKIPFGKYKGKTWEELTKFEAGLSYMRWLVDQPVEGKYAEANEKRNEALKNLLMGYPPIDEDPKRDPKDDLLADCRNRLISLEHRVNKLEGDTTEDRVEKDRIAGDEW